MSSERGQDDLTKAAHGADREPFAQLFVQSSLYFLAVPERFAPGLPAEASREQILAQVEEAARDLSETHDFQPFSYDDDGRCRMPVFSSEELASQFAQWYATRTRRLIHRRGARATRAFRPR